MLEHLIETYESEKKEELQSIHALLDYYQQKYIIGEITINDYKDIFACLHKEGAVSAFENTETENSML